MARTPWQFLPDSRGRARRRCSRCYARVQQCVLPTHSNPGDSQARARFETTGAAAFEIDPRRQGWGSKRDKNDQIAKTIIEYRLIDNERRSKKAPFDAGFKASGPFRPKRTITDKCRVV